MIITSAIKSSNVSPMIVTWDIGKRCNFDCSYCEMSRHDNISPYTPLDELKKTFDFIKKWTTLYESKKKVTEKVGINFTGGEPTINPDFWKLIEYIKQDSTDFNLSLTTNGSWGEKYSKKISTEFNGVTISYHTEGPDHLKKRTIKNIFSLAETGIWLQVNVMLHADHWQEGIELCDLLKQKGIKHNPRPIGDGNIERKGWFIDTDGSNRRTSHDYNSKQKEWFWNYFGIKEKSETSSEGTNIGRACCGGRCLQGKVDGEWQTVKLVNTEFKNWYCSVDWFFLHIEQSTKSVFHHQTCKATHKGIRGPIGTLDDCDSMIADLKNYLKNPIPIVCPNQRCGCGMCVPKAADLSDFNIIKSSFC
jgi:MoaA/NifB/PqqE/SkfB family radical SAM enzyme